MAYQHQIDRAEATLERIAATVERTEGLLAAVLDTLVTRAPAPRIQLPPSYTQGAHYAAAFPLASNPQDAPADVSLASLQGMVPADDPRSSIDPRYRFDGPTMGRAYTETAPPYQKDPLATGGVLYDTHGVGDGLPTPDVAVAAHFETVHLAFTTWVPAHGTRADDPNYHYFNEARDRLKAAGKLVCWRCGSTEDIQIHHDKCEWCSINGVDIARFAAHFPALFTGLTGDITDAEFARAIESEGGLLPLCQHCHTGKSAGIHYVPYPIWLQGAYERAGLPPPAQPVIVSAVTAATPDDNTKDVR